jgi:hypothetical protein
MIALRSLTTDEQDDMRTDLAETRRVLANLQGWASQPVDRSLREKLVWQIEACQRHIARYEKALAS